MWNQNILVPEVIAIKRLKDGLNVAELFHGPTLAFKDLALTFVGELYNYFLEKSKKNCIIVVGKYRTSCLFISPLFRNKRFALNLMP